jgi:molecular chaperone Hsp33
MGEPRSAVIDDDLVQPLQIDRFKLRGRLVRLGSVVDSVLRRHAYPEPVATMLGEALVLAAALATALKYDGIFTLQTKGDGPIEMLVVDITSEGEVRGYAQFDAVRLAALSDDGPSGAVPRLLGAGHLAFTVDQGDETQRYQGIVELEGATLADCVHNYFRQSEQIDAAVKLAVGRVANGVADQAWRGACLMVQRLPDAELMDAEFGDFDGEDGWRRALVFMSSATTGEMLDPNLTPRRLLYRLFHEDGVRVYKPRPLRFGCRCSRARVERILRSLPRAEVEDMKVNGEVIVTCQFCNESRHFDEPALDRLYAT